MPRPKAPERPQGYHADPKFREPFKYGYRRELVYRQPGSRIRGDVYYISPEGNYLRSANAVQLALKSSKIQMTMENFTFDKVPLGIDDPDKEVVRHSKKRGKRNHDVPRDEFKKIKRDKRLQNTDNSIIKESKLPTGEISPGSAVIDDESHNNYATDEDDADMRLAMSEDDDYTLPKDNAELTTTGRNGIDNNGTSESTKRVEVCTQKTASFASTPELPKTNTSKYSKYWEKMSFMNSFLTDYRIHERIFRYLDIEDLLMAEKVCRAWRMIIGHQPDLWKRVQISNTQMTHDVARCLENHKTEHLSVITKGDNWETFIEAVPTIESLSALVLHQCPATTFEEIVKNCPHLQVVRALSIEGGSIDVECLAGLRNPKKLQIGASTNMALEGDLSCLSGFSQLTHLSLESIRSLGEKNIEVLKSLQTLQLLELGDCSGFPETFGSSILKELKDLKHLRLEKIEDSRFIADLLTSVSKLEKLTKLELVNIRIGHGFEEHLAKCKHVKKLAIVPVYESTLSLQSAETNNIILKGIKELSCSLENLVLGINEALFSFSQQTDYIPILMSTSHLPANGLYITGDEDFIPVAMLSLSRFKTVFTSALPKTQIIILKTSDSAVRHLRM